jgi:hypothetical protein
MICRLKAQCLVTLPAVAPKGCNMQSGLVNFITHVLKF